MFTIIADVILTIMWGFVIYPPNGYNRLSVAFIGTVAIALFSLFVLLPIEISLEHIT